MLLFSFACPKEKVTKKEKDKGGFSHFQKYLIFGVTKPSGFIHCTKTQPLSKDFILL